jgi:Zn ribbon nucleic-acid-binding protein
MSWQLKRLIYGGTCLSCQAPIEINAQGWHSPELHKVRCSACGSPESIEPNGSRANPVGGSSAYRYAIHRHDRRSLKGAAGEYRVDEVLHRELGPGSRILTDRQIPNTPTNVDHIVVAASGVWVIDSKKWSGEIRYKSITPLSSEMHLYVGGQDRTHKLDAIYKLVLPVAQVIGDHSVPIHPAMVFVSGDWHVSALPRFILRRPYRHEDHIWISPLRILIPIINAPGPLDTASVNRLADQLDAALPVR